MYCRIKSEVVYQFIKLYLAVSSLNVIRKLKHYNCENELVLFEPIEGTWSS